MVPILDKIEKLRRRRIATFSHLLNGDFCFHINRPSSRWAVRQRRNLSKDVFTGRHPALDQRGRQKIT